MGSNDPFFRYVASVRDIFDQIPLPAEMDAKLKRSIHDAVDSMSLRDEDLENFLTGTTLNLTGVDGAQVGTLPGGFVGFEMKAGSTVVTAAAGGVVIPFPNPFPNGVVTVVLSNGDNPGNAAVIEQVQTALTKVHFKVRVYDTAAAEIVAGNYRINWFALGF